MRTTLGFSIRLMVLVVVLMASIPAMASSRDAARDAAIVSSKEIAEAVRRSIVTHPNYDVFDWIEARVFDGMVTLSGSVREPWRKSEFEKRVMNIAGVSKIDNQIRVLPLSSYDDEIRLRVATTIYGSSMFERTRLEPILRFTSLWRTAVSC